MTPPGFAATLKGVPYCPEAALAEVADTGYSGVAELAAPMCPAASQIGTAVAGAGAGTHPVYCTARSTSPGPTRARR